MNKVEALVKLNNQLNSLGAMMTVAWYNSTEFLIRELFGEESSHFESFREMKNIDVHERGYDNCLGRIRFIVQGCIKDVEDDLFIKSEPSKRYKKLWEKYFSGGYNFDEAENLFEKDLSIQPKPHPKNQKPIKRAAIFISLVMKHPLWSAIIAGFTVLLLSHFIFHTPEKFFP